MTIKVSGKKKIREKAIDYLEGILPQTPQKRIANYEVIQFKVEHIRKALDIAIDLCQDQKTKQVEKLKRVLRNYGYRNHLDLFDIINEIFKEKK